MDFVQETQRKCLQCRRTHPYLVQPTKHWWWKLKINCIFGWMINIEIGSNVKCPHGVSIFRISKASFGKFMCRISGQYGNLVNICDHKQEMNNNLTDHACENQIIWIWHCNACSWNQSICNRAIELLKYGKGFHCVDGFSQEIWYAPDLSPTHKVEGFAGVSMCEIVILDDKFVLLFCGYIHNVTVIVKISSNENV